MIHVEQFIRPQSIPEALELLKSPDALILAGGTGVSLSRDPKVRTVVDLGDLDVLNQLEITPEKTRMGAMITMTRLRREATLHPVLVETARSIGSTPLRNVITVGGELARGVYWNDLPVTLMAMEANVELQSAEGSSIIPVWELFAEHPRKVLSGGKMITAVEISHRTPHVAYLKFARTLVDYAICDLACSLTVDDGVIREAIVAVSAVTALPRRIPEVEQQLIGGIPGDEVFARAAAATAEIELRPDFRVSREYQRQLLEGLTHRVLANAWNRKN